MARKPSAASWRPLRRLQAQLRGTAVASARSRLVPRAVGAAQKVRWSNLLARRPETRKRPTRTPSPGDPCQRPRGRAGDGRKPEGASAARAARAAGEAGRIRATATKKAAKRRERRKRPRAAVEVVSAVGADEEPIACPPPTTLPFPFSLPSSFLLSLSSSFSLLPPLPSWHGATR